MGVTFVSSPLRNRTDRLSTMIVSDNFRKKAASLLAQAIFAYTLITLPYLIGKQKYVSRILVLVSLERWGHRVYYMKNT